MMFFLPVFILAGTGFVAGLVCHRIWKNFWPATFAATLAATAIWTGGVYILLATAAPSELGPPLLGPMLKIAALTFVSAASAGAVMKRRSTHQS